MTARRIAWLDATLDATRGGPLANGLLAGISRAIAAVEVWSERRRQRRALASMPAYMMKDVGITPQQAWAEARKPFWQD